MVGNPRKMRNGPAVPLTDPDVLAAMAPPTGATPAEDATLTWDAAAGRGRDPANPDRAGERLDESS
jgi:hypothetical protein